MDHRLARLSVDRGLGPETLYEPQPATDHACRACRWHFRTGGFLQATADGEARWSKRSRRRLAARRAIADLFAGLGTFALATRASLRRRSIARCRGGAEAGRAGDDCRASRPLSPAARCQGTEAVRRRRSSIRRAPGPSRAGRCARAAQRCARIAYVSCNPATFARDAKTLVDGGYALDWVEPVGQFRWSTHVELAACFSR